MRKCKFSVNGKQFFGLNRGTKFYFATGEGTASPGSVFVEEALTGKIYEIPIKNVTEIEEKFPEWDDEEEWKNTDEYDTFVQDEYKKAQALDLSCNGEFKAGRMIKTPVGDGCACYVITKVNKTTCKLEWRGFEGDRWVDHMIGYGGSFPRKMFERLI